MDRHRLFFLRNRRFMVGIGTVIMVFVMMILSAFDQQWTGRLRQFRDLKWLSWMDQSVFEGGFVGAGDVTLGIYFFVFCLFLRDLWNSLVLQNKETFSQHRLRLLGRILVAGLLVAGVTHGLKGLMGRPRPTDFFGGRCEFKPWFQVSSEGPCSRRFRGGSFPSGHTSSAASLLFPLAAYVEVRRKGDRFLWFLTCGGVLAYACVMGISRVMHGDHWVTDVWASLCINVGMFFIYWQSVRVAGVPLDKAR